MRQSTFTNVETNCARAIAQQRRARAKAEMDRWASARVAMLLDAFPAEAKASAARALFRATVTVLCALDGKLETSTLLMARSREIAPEDLRPSPEEIMARIGERLRAGAREAA